MDINCNKQQKSNLGSTTGSFINYMMGNNSSLPEVGKGATILHWTDRTACEVLSVSADGKKVVIQAYTEKRIDTNGMSECQTYDYSTLNGHDQVIVWKWGAWREEGTEVVWTEEFKNIYESCQTPEERRAAVQDLYDEDNNILVVPGKTKRTKTYHKVNIIWGVKRHYYDFSF